MSTNFLLRRISRQHDDFNKKQQDNQMTTSMKPMKIQGPIHQVSPMLPSKFDMTSKMIPQINPQTTTPPMHIRRSSWIEQQEYSPTTC